MELLNASKLCAVIVAAGILFCTTSARAEAPKIEEQPVAAAEAPATAAPEKKVEKAPSGETPEKKAETKCHLEFSLHGWSVFYKTASGEGKITCDNGQQSRVAIKTHGGGVTFGKSKITNGHGTFSSVKSIDELYGSYAASEAHAGIKGSAGAQAMTKGRVSLALHGTGKGYDLGFAFGSFKITPEKE